MPASGYELRVEKEDPASHWEYQLISGTSAEPSSGWITPDENPRALFDNNTTNSLVIKVTSEGGEKTKQSLMRDEYGDIVYNIRTGETGAGTSSHRWVYDKMSGRKYETKPDGYAYYRINVELLAANFKQHPKSAAYYYYRDPAEAELGRIMDVVIEYNEDGTPKTIGTLEQVWEMRDANGNWETITEGTTTKPNPLYDESTATLQPKMGVLLDYGSPTPFISDTPDALNFVLDERSGSAGFTYQWYESNSWYGGYGFDEDGNRCYNIPDPIDPTKIQFNYEADFKGDQFHARQFDEKANPSLFNGGNQAARYVIDGRPIPTEKGGRGATYTPDISKRPFLGYSYETHYYWVVVTDPVSGRKATSARATILAERNKAKTHLMLDVNNDLKNDNGMPIRFKNYEVFKERYDKFRIPLKDVLAAAIARTPGVSSFDIKDYMILTAQAKFYLSDGTEWIQNWTNGNLSFEDNALAMDAENRPNKDTPFSDHGPVHPDGTLMGLFYNLTNNNATYDITSDVKEDGNGSALKDLYPTHIVIEPSGDHTKGPNKDGYPALEFNPETQRMEAAEHLINVDLQGWFCGYVELVELHFEGPR
jgi:hypothetical protein